ncbi:MAG: RidA family protein [Nitrospiraceae bacterium]|nr:RidA family protein [Nitrospiraceae bacterium]
MYNNCIMITPEQKLKDIGITLPDAPKPLASYLPCVQTGKLFFLSGVLPLREGKLTKTGKVGESVTLEEAQQEARQIVINALSILKSHIKSLNSVKRCIKLTGYVASAQNFHDQPKVLNAASDLLFEIFGESGRHARAAVGVNTLPFNASVEIEFIFEI